MLHFLKIEYFYLSYFIYFIYMFDDSSQVFSFMQHLNPSQYIINATSEKNSAEGTALNEDVHACTCLL